MIRRGDTWYERVADGWLRWDPVVQEWVPSAPPPPPPIPPAPVPPPDIYEEMPRRIRPAMAVLALVTGLLVLVAVGLSPVIGAWLERDPVRAPVATPPVMGPQPPPLFGGDMATEDVTYLSSFKDCITRSDLAHLRQSIQPVGAPADELPDVARVLEDLRGLGFEESVEPRFISAAEMRRRLTEEALTRRDRQEIRVIQRVLVALGAMEPGRDLLELTKDLIGDAVVGFYLPESKELFVRRSPSSALAPDELVTVAHEMGHALVDQNLGLGIEPDFPDAKAEEQFARRALIEGDAVVLQEQFAALQLTPEQNLARSEAGAEASSTLASLPHFLVRSFSFPYNEGPLFVCHLVATGGWEAVDALYRNPPRATDQIIFPGRLGEPAGERAPRSRNPGRAWKRWDTGPIGAAELLFLFEAPGGDTARGWPSDVAHLYAGALAAGVTEAWTRGRKLAIGISLLQRPDYPQGSLCTGIEAWYRMSFPEGRDISRARTETMAMRHGRGVGILRCPGNRVHLGAAPTAAIARSLLR